MKKFEIFFGIIKVPLDFLMTVLAFLSAYNLRLITKPIEGIAKPIDFSVLPTLNEYLTFSFTSGIILVVIFALGKAYSLKSTLSFSRESRKLLTLCGIWVMVIITYFFFTRTLPYSRLAILYSWTFTFFFVLGGRFLIRLFQKGFLKMNYGKRNLLFIGNNNVTEEIYKSLKSNLSYKIAGMIGNRSGEDSGLRYLGSLNQLKYIIKKYKIDEIIQTRSDIKESQAGDILELCELNHISYRFTPDLMDVRRTNIEIDVVADIPVISIKATPLDGWGKVSKRILDIIGSVFGLIIFSPVFLITMIAIKLDSKGPVIFSKLDDGTAVKRVGRKGKLFRFYKFRSMKPKTDSLRYKSLKENNLRNDGPLIKIENDPRVTRVGKFIRKYSIDELPQLVSVLKGDMSLVGPRPHLPEEVKNYKKHHKFVLTIKPGITGLSQISGRSDLPFEDEVKLDRFYIENWSILSDLRIILKTFGVILKGYKE